MTDCTTYIEKSKLVALTAEIVESYVSNNKVMPSELPGLIASVNDSLVKAAAREIAQPEQRPAPAVSVRKFVRPEAIACLECGKTLKSLKRHLRTEHDLTPEEYRERWGLRPDYPTWWRPTIRPRARNWRNGWVWGSASSWAESPTANDHVRTTL